MTKYPMTNNERKMAIYRKFPNDICTQGEVSIPDTYRIHSVVVRRSHFVVDLFVIDL